MSKASNTKLQGLPIYPSTHSPIYRFALLTAVASFLLIVAGGLVTSTDSALSVPDWPLSYGKVFPPMVGGIRFEHSHRMIAATVGMLTLILAIWILRKESRKWVRRLAIGAFLAVLVQGLLGGLTVLMGLPLAVSVGHAMLGPTFFAAITLLAAVLSPRWKINSVSPARPEHLPGIPAFMTTRSLFMVAAVLVQLFLGALLRHAGWNPKIMAAHILGAIAVLILGIALRDRLLKVLLAMQILLGAWTLARGGDAVSATAHVAVGALLLARSLVLSARLIQKQKQNGVPGPTRALAGAGRYPAVLSAYLELTKPRLTGLAVLSGLCGFLLASGGPLSMGRIILTLLGTALVGGGAGALNQVLERREDALMNRTRNRPIPSGRLGVDAALRFGVAIASAGLIILTLAVNRLSGLLGVVTLVSYLFLYTPLKRKTSLCTLVGAIPGAMPPAIGWAACRGSVEFQGWILFAILFLWQLPHFLAIAWSYREDYARAGFKMLPVVDEEGGATLRQIALYCAALVPVSIFPTGLGLAGFGYCAAALLGSLAFFGVGVAALCSPTQRAAKRLFLASVLYLPWILTAMTLDRIL